MEGLDYVAMWMEQYHNPISRQGEEKRRHREGERERGRDCRPVGRDVDRVVEVESVESVESGS